MTKRFVFIVQPGDRPGEAPAFALARELTEDGRHPLTYVGTKVDQFDEFREILGDEHVKKS